MSGPSDGGPAYPTQAAFTGNGDLLVDASAGMSLRDFFAAQYLAGLASDTGWTKPKEETAAWCYEVADAMLAAREGKP